MKCKVCGIKIRSDWKEKCAVCSTLIPKKEVGK